MRRAVIDIGTNTVKVLVADVGHALVQPVLTRDKTTRLGESVNHTGLLKPQAIKRTADAVAELHAEAHRSGAQKIVALTTSAARDAGNREDFLRAVRQRCGLEVMVISGDREAELIFRGVSSDPDWSEWPLLVMDVGGGSAEFIQGRCGQMDRHQSLPLGAVRLTEMFGEDRFADLCGHLRASLYQALASFDFTGRHLVATGGSINILAAILKRRSDHARVTQDELRQLLAQLNAVPLEERKKYPGLPADRADIIVAGGMVYLTAMEILGAFELTVSTRNLRYGALITLDGP
jgi:exopolyphosphatase/guanosine-5'-triphosphate,3'-diphosphate pyrophosphatase